jgi:hypothetical protein
MEKRCAEPAPVCLQSGDLRVTDRHASLSYCFAFAAKFRQLPLGYFLRRGGNRVAQSVVAGEPRAARRHLRECRFVTFAIGIVH